MVTPNLEGNKFNTITRQKEESPMKKIQRDMGSCKTNSAGLSFISGLLAGDFETRIALIQELIPIGLMAVKDALQHEVMELAGSRYSRESTTRDIVRWGSQHGSVYLQDMKVKVQVPRVRNRQTNKEVPLTSYQALQAPTKGDNGLLRKVLHGLSCNKYKETASLVPEVFGISPSSVSKRFIVSSSKKLKEFNARRLEKYDLVAVVVDGKTFADDQM